jgi:hypothetical protein
MCAGCNGAGEIPCSVSCPATASQQFVAHNMCLLNASNPYFPLVLRTSPTTRRRLPMQYAFPVLSETTGNP